MSKKRSRKARADVLTVDAEMKMAIQWRAHLSSHPKYLQKLEELRREFDSHPELRAELHLLDAGVHSNMSLPPAAGFVLLLMSRPRRNDVLNDVMDFWPHWVRDHGRTGAYVACWWHVGMAILGGFLDLTLKVAEIVGKFRGAK